MKSEKEIKLGTVLTYLQLVLSIVISLAYTPVMLRILGQNEYGLYGTVSSVIAWLPLLSLGFNGSYIRFYSSYKAKDNNEGIKSLNGIFIVVFSVLGFISLLCGIFLAFNLDLIYSSGLSAHEYSVARVLTLIMTADMAISFPATVFTSIIKSQQRFVIMKGLNIVQTVFSPLVALPLLLMGYGSIGMITATICVDIVVYSIFAWFCIKKLNAKFSIRNFDFKVLKSILTFSVFVAINSIVDQINNNLDKVILGRFCGTAVVAVYTIGFSIYTYYRQFSSAITSVLCPQINLRVNQLLDDKSKLRAYQTDTLVRTSRIQYYVLMLVLTGFIFFGKRFIFLWAGEGYEESYVIAVILMISSTITILQDVCAEMQRAQNKHQFRSIVYLIMALCNAGLTIVLCQKYGALGATVGTLIANVLANVLIMNIFYHKKLYINIFSFWKNLLKMTPGLILPVLAGIVYSRFVSDESIAVFILSICIYALIYFVSMFLFVFNKEEKEMLKSVKKRVLK